MSLNAIAYLIPRDMRIILQSVISPEKIEQEIKLAKFVLSRAAAVTSSLKTQESSFVW